MGKVGSREVRLSQNKSTERNSRAKVFLVVEGSWRRVWKELTENFGGGGGKIA
jgi:hypothetical protein